MNEFGKQTLIESDMMVDIYSQISVSVWTYGSKNGVLLNRGRDMLFWVFFLI